MKTETKTIAEYKTPRCKVVNLRVRMNILADSYGEGGEPGHNGNYDDETGGEDY